MAISEDVDLVFLVNGKADGSARSDAPTQVMLGMTSAILHPAPKRALVIGMGTGQSAGWLAQVPTMKQVDVVELEPAVLTVARRCAATNCDVLSNPKVRVMIGDGREVLLTAREKYDVIASEPSNPYRAGVAGLYTREFYQAAKNALAPGGYFSQWVQAYEVDVPTVATIIATLKSVFGSVDIWQTDTNDLLFVCSAGPEAPYPVRELRRRVAAEPFRTALLKAWRVTDLEGFLSRFVAGDGFCRLVAADAAKSGLLNTDDRMLVEFAFARTVGRTLGFSMSGLKEEAESRGEFRPRVSGDVDWRLVDENYILLFQTAGWQTAKLPRRFDDKDRALAEAFNIFRDNRCRAFLDAWLPLGRDPRYPTEIAMAAESFAELGNAAALPLADRLAPMFPAEANAIRARYLARTGNTKEALDILLGVYERLAVDPWVDIQVAYRSLLLGMELAERNRDAATAVFGSLMKPFTTGLLTEERRLVLFNLAKKLDYYPVAPNRLVIDHSFLEKVIPLFDPNGPWNEDFLKERWYAYDRLHAPGAPAALADYRDFLADTSPTTLLLEFPGTAAPSPGGRSGTP